MYLWSGKTRRWHSFNFRYAAIYDISPPDFRLRYRVVRGVSEVLLPLWIRVPKPCPTSIKVYLFGIDFHGGKIYLETSFSTQTNLLSEASGQGRIVGCLTSVGYTPRIVIIAHLDHPGVLVQLQIPDVYFDERNDGTVRRLLHFPELLYSSCQTNGRHGIPGVPGPSVSFVQIWPSYTVWTISFTTNSQISRSSHRGNLCWKRTRPGT